jgi:hypothetical protein
MSFKKKHTVKIERHAIQDTSNIDPGVTIEDVNPQFNDSESSKGNSIFA